MHCNGPILKAKFWAARTAVSRSSQKILVYKDTGFFHKVVRGEECRRKISKVFNDIENYTSVFDGK